MRDTWSKCTVPGLPAPLKPYRYDFGWWFSFSFSFSFSLFFFAESFNSPLKLHPGSLNTEQCAEHPHSVGSWGTA